MGVASLPPTALQAAAGLSNSMAAGYAVNADVVATRVAGVAIACVEAPIPFAITSVARDAKPMLRGAESHNKRWNTTQAHRGYYKCAARCC